MDMDMDDQLTIGLARIHKEPGERRDFLPSFVARLAKNNAKISLEYGYGSGMRYVEEDYLRLADNLTFTSLDEIYRQDIVLVLRYTTDEQIRKMRAGSCLISMLHYPTRPQRVEFLRSVGIEAISLDSLCDDSGRRLVENLKAVAWNGIEAAFRTLRSTYPDPGLGNPTRPPIQVTLMGAGAVGMNVVQAAIRYGDDDLHKHFASTGIPGVCVRVIDYDITPHESLMLDLLKQTDILVDATQRPNPARPVIPNEWVGYLPEHAVILDLSVDPYNCETDPPSMKGIEGIPQGNLDQYIFSPSDSAFDHIPECVNTTHRRHTVSCYSWPGIYPKKCMGVYGRQLNPILRTLIEKGGIKNIDHEGNYFERAISRAMLSRWPVVKNGDTDNHN
jgi:alanine dehydrogenase